MSEVPFTEMQREILSKEKFDSSKTYIIISTNNYYIYGSVDDTVCFISINKTKY